ncbi:nucleotide pyrophosphohydrolase [Candidatus Falkowbacteria bacterium HGW-Falkowbacteria-2]|uniref:Nucleotide pyrophosphohydrolase n=1 Tax=Candidatus Falkowbacteria bacterium HGW-Falkowbacteria-2 TaxID=2013769 RepID=A0A2N2DXF8_9BACT|nr:MAG: nucleotide pyrophosphohydrolase [Candidatus Falkowbacteria bacterium HGW-Falkowbacteria-2]
MKELEQLILNFLRVRKWDNLRPGDLAKSIMIEGAELLEHFQWENLTLEEVKAQPEKIEEIKKELADVLIYTLQLSTLLGFDTVEIIRHKLELADKKYPVSLMINRSENDNTYQRIKKEYRSAKNS